MSLWVKAKDIFCHLLGQIIEHTLSYVIYFRGPRQSKLIGQNCNWLEFGCAAVEKEEKHKVIVLRVWKLLTLIQMFTLVLRSRPFLHTRLEINMICDTSLVSCGCNFLLKIKISSSTVRHKFEFHPVDGKLHKFTIPVVMCCGPPMWDVVKIMCCSCLHMLRLSKVSTSVSFYNQIRWWRRWWWFLFAVILLNLDRRGRKMGTVCL